jgi:tetratricopeptide (TPR) repeat protein
MKKIANNSAASAEPRLAPKKRARTLRQAQGRIWGTAESGISQILRTTVIYFSLCAIAFVTALFPVSALSQEASNPSISGGVLQGHVRESNGKIVVNATVSLHLQGGGRMLDIMSLGIPTQIAYTDEEGAYRFAAIPDGDYILKVTMPGYIFGIVNPVIISHKTIQTIDVVLKPTKVAEAHNSAVANSGKPEAIASSPEFFDEPQFTVAGVTEGSNSGGHGADPVVRSAEALAKATVSLSHEANKASTSEPEAATAAREGSLRAELARNPEDPALHHQLAEVEEKLGNPLEAVREFQRAAELDPSEQHIFDWGVELLTHRALAPASKVFAKGNHLFPQSVRMLIARGVADYARGDYDQAGQNLGKASDLAPDNPTPYLFLGRMQSVIATLPEDSVEKLRRFAQLQPENALANYYYAVSLLRESAREQADTPEREKERSARAESLLQKAVHLDSNLAAAYLQLGILYAQRSDYARAIVAYRKAIEVTPEDDELEHNETLEQSHYRLAQAYLRSGDKVKGQEELQIHARLSKKLKQNSARERREIREFVISVRGEGGETSPKK